MRTEIKYIELKSGFSDNGPAWIGEVRFSKSGRTVYFNGRAFKGNGHGACYDVETGEEYWITGVKKSSWNRHYAGGGIIRIDRRIAEEYRTFIRVARLDPRRFQIIDVQETDIARFSELENEKQHLTNLSVPEDVIGISDEELRKNIGELRWKEDFTRTSHGQKFIRGRRLKMEKMLDGK